MRFCAKRSRCAWGDISIVTATLALVDDALAGAPCDYYCLLSGNCYPVRSLAYVRKFLSNSRGTEYIQAFPFPNDTYGKTIDRLSRYFIKRKRPFHRAKAALQSIIQHVLPARDYQRAFGSMELATGAQWWCLTRPALEYVQKFIADHPRFYRFCRHIDCPDEFVFQMILWNSPFRARLSHTLTYTDWHPGESGPVKLDASHLAAFGQRPVLDSSRNNCPDDKREVLFARKFDDRSNIITAIDKLASGH